MTTIHDLPEETLLLIFKQLPARLHICQKVCRAWYRTIHTLILNNVVLDSGYKIDRFIASIDSNPDPAYLKSVKKIQACERSFGSADPTSMVYVLNKTKIQKLFLRFSNLQQVDLRGSNLAFLKEFNEEICLEFAKSCPKLELFEMEYPVQDAKQWYTVLSNIRLVLTNLSLRNITSIPGYDTLQQYIMSFPRLKTLHTLKTPVNTICEFLPVFTQLPLSNFDISGAAEEQEYFAETYMASQSQEEKDQLVRRLSELKSMSWAIEDTFCLNAIKFIAKYMTGLSSIYIYACLDKARTNMPQQLFFHASLDLITPIDDS